MGTYTSHIVRSCAAKRLPSRESSLRRNLTLISTMLSVGTDPFACARVRLKALRETNWAPRWG